MSHAKRNSIGQLALPTTLVTVTPGSPTTSHSPLGLNSPTTTSPTKPSFGPVQPLPITTSNIQLHNAQYPASASTYTGHVAAFTSGGSITSPVSPTSVRSTHAGGIQPNASFFRPVRPGQYNNSPGRLGLPPRFDDSSDDDDGAASSVDHNQRPAQKNDTLAPRPHPLSTSLSHSSSLSAHQHHHSNHSSELVKAHEDGNRTSDEQPPQTPHGVSGKPSKEFLLSGQQANGNPQAKSKRVSIDASAIPPPSSLTAKRNSASYKPRLTFESLRRSMDSATGSKRFSFGRSNDNSNMVLESGSDGEGLREETGIPLTPRSPKAKRRSKLYRSTSASSVRSGISSAAGHFVDRMTVANDEGVLGEDGTEDRSSSATPTPTSFDPRPPPLEKGEYPLMKTPLYHPLDPSLVPERRLQKMQKRGRKGYVPDSAANGRTKAGSEGSLALPTTTRTKRKSKGFLTFLYPSPPATPTADGEKTTKIPVSLPVSSAPKEGTPVKRWFLHPSRNSFFFGGRCMTGGDNPWPFILTLTIVCGVAGVWFGCVGRWWWVEGGLGVANEAVRIMNGGVEGNVIGSEGSVVVGDRQLYVVNPAARRAGKAVVIMCAYAAALVLSSMLITAFSDPGVLPRNLDPDPPYPATSPLDGELRTPMPRDLKVRSDVVRVKYCPTCRTYRPPRSSHCKMCDNCVDTCDHHCQWVNNCVGRRNYTSFFVLLMTATLTLCLIIVTAALQLYFLTRWQDLSFRQALGRTPGTAVVFCLAIIVIWPVGALLSYHLRLLLLNVTTIEQIRNQAHKSLVPGPPPPNPFSHGSWRKNFFAVLCRPEPLSWLDGSAIATEDRREINPGMLMDNSELRRQASAAALSSSRSHGHGHGGDEWDDVLISRKRDEDNEDEDA